MKEKKGLLGQDNQAYTSDEVVLGMVKEKEKETSKGKFVVRNHFKSSTQEELDMKIAEILSKLINKELESVKQ